MYVHVQTRTLFAAQTGFRRRGDDKEGRGDHAARAWVACFVLFSVTARCYAIWYYLSFGNSFHGCNSARFQSNIYLMFRYLNVITFFL